MVLGIGWHRLLAYRTIGPTLSLSVFFFHFFLPQSHHLLLPTGCVTLAVFLSFNLIFSNYLSFRLNDE